MKRELADAIYEKAPMASVVHPVGEHRTICWFSCGDASAVATKLMLAKHPDAIVCRIWLKEEHPDNDRFARDCEKWFDRPIKVLTAHKYGGSIYEVFRRERYLVGPGGAHCSGALKKAVREAFERPSDVQAFGYTATEQGRVDRFIDANPLVKMALPLMEANLTKEDCHAIVRRTGIALPVMYRLGYENNNCIGCVKGGAGYWNKVRIDFPDVFERMAQMEEHLGRTVCRVNGERVTLRQLPPNVGDMSRDQPSECGIFCLMAETTIRGGA